MMKVSRNSWHYRFINTMGFFPEQTKTKTSYISRFIQSVLFAIFAFGWIIYIKNRLTIKSEPVEFIDDKKKEKDE